MRFQQLFEYCLANYDYRKAFDLARNNVIKGGWEVWLQVEWAFHLAQNQNENIMFEREVQYPNSGERCDFFTCYVNQDGTLRDESYIELKCVNQYAANTQIGVETDALNRYARDILKVRGKSVLCDCILVYYGNINTACSFITTNGICTLGEMHVFELGDDANMHYIGNMDQVNFDNRENMFIFHYEPAPW